MRKVAGSALITGASKIMTLSGSAFDIMLGSQSIAERFMNLCTGMILTAPVTIPLITVGLLLNPTALRRQSSLDED